MENFTPVSGLIGGLLIGVSAALFLLLNGRIAGISGILGGALEQASADGAWRYAFLAGLVATDDGREGDAVGWQGFLGGAHDEILSCYCDGLIAVVRPETHIARSRRASKTNGMARPGFGRRGVPLFGLACASATRGRERCARPTTLTAISAVGDQEGKAF